MSDTAHHLTVVLPDLAPRVGLALSGGGFRAAAFHLGVLKRLEELGVLQRIDALSTVSGGSITGALYALRCAQHGGLPGAYPVDALIAELRPCLAANLRARALFGTSGRALRTALSFVSPRISRISLIVAELGAQLFGGATLDQLPPWIVINATNLRTGKAWRFFSDRAGDYLAGATTETNHILVAEAIAASAAYPGLTDSFAFATRWEHLRGDLLDAERWERPPNKHADDVSRWRARYGAAAGPVVFPLADGGLYDNEGMNALRGCKVTHAILSGVAPPESDAARGFGLGRMLRVVEVVHDRLGAATRQLAHEMTHAIHPRVAAATTSSIAQSLRKCADDPALPASTRATLEAHAETLDALGPVALPPRGHQFIASAQVLLHRTDLATNAYAHSPYGAVDVPGAYRGLSRELVEELSRVRTDLDALEPEVLDLLVAQGYFLTDLMVKLTMPDLLGQRPTTGAGWYDGALAPDWAPAMLAVASANANTESMRVRLRRATSRLGVMGRVANARERWRYRLRLALVVVPLVILALLALALAGHVLWRAAQVIWSLWGAQS